MIGYVIDGVPATIEYGLTTSEDTTFLGVLGGPLFNVFISLICLSLVYMNSKHKEIWGIIGLVASVGRLVVVSIIFFIGVFINSIVLQRNDEGQLAVLMGRSIYVQYIISLLIYWLISLLIIKLLGNNKLYNKIYLKVLIYNMILTICLLFF